MKKRKEHPEQSTEEESKDSTKDSTKDPRDSVCLKPLFILPHDIPPDKEDRHKFLKILAAGYAAGKLLFPYKAQYMGNPKEMLDRLKIYHVPVSYEEEYPHNIRFQSDLFPLKFRSGFYIFKHMKCEYKNMDAIVDLFEELEQQRLKARRADTGKSVWELFRDPRVVLNVLNAAVSRWKYICPETVRESLYSLVKECTQFKPTLAAEIIRLFNAKRVLDFSAGWGDRMVGAMAADVDLYQGYDPNTALKPGHTRLIKTLVPEDRQHCFQIEYQAFETVTDTTSQLEPESFDLVFTSPPFFNFEIYTTLPGQSVDSYPTLELWLAKFLCKSLKKSWDALKPGGHLVIHLTDVYKTKICEFMCCFMIAYCPDCVYEGVLCSSGLAAKPRPLWVFVKDSLASSVSSVSKVSLAKQWLAKINPEAYRYVLEL